MAEVGRQAAAADQAVKLAGPWGAGQGRVRRVEGEEKESTRTFINEGGVTLVTASRNSSPGLQHSRGELKRNFLNHQNRSRISRWQAACCNGMRGIC